MKNSSQADWGFTLFEMVVVIAIMGTLLAIAAPSLLSAQKPLKDSVAQTESLLKTVNLIARANSGNPYRIRPVYNAAVGNFPGGYSFKVETSRNGSCSTSLTALGWVADASKEVPLSSGVVITDTNNVEFKNMTNPQNLTICFDGRGNEASGGITFYVKDPQNRSKARWAKLEVSAVGDVNRTAYDAGNAVIAGGSLW